MVTASGGTGGPAPASVRATGAGTAYLAPSSVADGTTHEENPRVPAGASWTEHYFPSSDGSDVELHADVLRPAHLPADAQTPVILSVGPYFAHYGQTGDDGFTRTGPSERFDDLIDGASLMERGYTVVMVDLRGFGGSTGCLDWAGPGEQADVVAAVEWSVSQPWSTGRVGLYGKSYDAVTGLVGANHEPDGLEDDQLAGVRLQVEASGAAETLRSMTEVNAELIGDRRLGHLGVGAWGDAALLTGDPLQDPSVLWEQDARRAVVRDGRVVGG